MESLLALACLPLKLADSLTRALVCMGMGHVPFRPNGGAVLTWTLQHEEQDAGAPEERVMVAVADLCVRCGNLYWTAPRDELDPLGTGFRRRDVR